MHIPSDVFLFVLYLDGFRYFLEFIAYFTLAIPTRGCFRKAGHAYGMNKKGHQKAT